MSTPPRHIIVPSPDYVRVEGADSDGNVCLTVLDEKQEVACTLRVAPRAAQIIHAAVGRVLADVGATWPEGTMQIRSRVSAWATPAASLLKT